MNHPTHTETTIDAAPSEALAEDAYRRIRESGPVVPLRLPDGLRIWAVTRYALGRSVLQDPRFVKSRTEIRRPHEMFGGRRYAEDVMAAEGDHLLNAPPDGHARLRGLIAPHLSARAVRRREPRIAEVADELIEQVADRSEFDLAADVARPLVTRVISEIIGIPVEFAPRVSAYMQRISDRIDPLGTDYREASALLVDLLRELIREPRDPDSGRLLDILQQEYRHGRISRREITSNIVMLLAAGTASTQITLCYGTVVLCTRPEERRRLLDGPAPAAAFVEELLRYHAPFPFSPWRFAADDTEIAGCTIPAGEPVLVLLSATNRDPDGYPDPDTFDSHRTAGPPHLAFGYGPHFCAGAHLARAEARIALTTLFTRIPTLHLAVPPSHLTWRGLLFDRTITELPVLTT
ncbi:cytochrome P450 [Nocardia mexicana]|uniref:Cytochrome P450 n=1 Tax=Nocardia mexicana TaxID=279262 RepID=A0A370H493_9NOCA|nr:cytochrome P450 [Nocardia mexicana]RDI50744.1 cytochrome P450 [Nocardia mexicana]